MEKLHYITAFKPNNTKKEIRSDFQHIFMQKKGKEGSNYGMQTLFSS